MEYTRLGSTGTQVSRLCLGTMSFGSQQDWMIDEEASFAIVRRAVEAGINFFDTADAYSRGESEEILGRALKEYGGKRERYVVATKVYIPMSLGANTGGLSRKHIMHSIDASLKRLGTEYVDLFQIHRFDYHTPMEETIAALDDVVKAGKALYVGASSMLGYQFAKYLALADRLGRNRFVTMQNQYSLLYREEEREMNPLCVEEGVGLMPWSPLAGGALVGNQAAGTARSKSALNAKRFQRPQDQAVIDTLRQIAEARGESPAQVALAWLLSRPGVTAPVIGATRIDQLDAPLNAVTTRLSPEEIAALEKPYAPQRVDRTLARPQDPSPAAPRAA
ncbi:MAG: aldo/keto reductase [Sphingomonadales bacterium]|nr:aldo/keto reductase [Sphingomonadales bacterium]